MPPERPPPTHTVGLAVKRLLDVFLAASGLLVLSPLLLVTAILVKRQDGGPVIYRQERAGLYGRPFTLYKFRTMVEDADRRLDEVLPLNEMSGPAFKIRNDPRLTRLGGFLRRASIDELPQLYNVLRGEMSLVGPRPPLPSEVRRYERWQMRRLSVKPGLTCIWQVSGRNELDFETWVRLDLQYIDNWSLLLDLELLLATLPAVILRRGAH